MDVREAIRGRRSIRRYKEGAVIPKADIEKILEAAMMAPSACNLRPWDFVVVSNRKKLDEIMEMSPYTQMLKTASCAVIVCGEPQEFQGVVKEFWPQDCGAAIENMLLEAEGLGYGTCWCGFYPVMERVELLRQAFEIKTIPMAVVALGVPEEKPDARGYYDPQKVRFID